MLLSQQTMHNRKTSIINLFRLCWKLYLLAKKCSVIKAFTNNLSKRLFKTTLSLSNRLQRHLVKYHQLKQMSQTSRAQSLNLAETILFRLLFKRKLRDQSSAYSIPVRSKTWQLNQLLKHPREGSRCLQMISSWILSSWRT
jgi:hypothetical protein